MDVFTIQVGRWRLANSRKIEFIDTTVKSGAKMFAPSWEMVLGYKAGTISEEEYAKAYRKLMRESWIHNREEWIAFLKRDEPVALACYCKPGEFCHRLLLKDIMKELCSKLNIEFRFYGELT